MNGWTGSEYEVGGRRRSLRALLALIVLATVAAVALAACLGGLAWVLADVIHHAASS